jgi:hypothetical protein
MSAVWGVCFLRIFLRGCAPKRNWARAYSKEHAVKQLSRRYSTRSFDEESVQLCLYSIADNHAYLRYNRGPIEKMVGLLEHYFHPTSGTATGQYSLAITGEREGARLTHAHEKQYAYNRRNIIIRTGILN